MKVVIIGYGNTATVLGKAIQEAGHSIAQIAGRNGDKAKTLAAVFQSEGIGPGELLVSDADIYIIAVSDDAITDCMDDFPLQQQLVVHTSGAVPMRALHTISENYGVLYPLQSLRKENDRIPDMPFLIDASHLEHLETIQQLAATMSANVSKAGDEERLKLHLAAVVVNNFTNHLYHLAYQFCSNENIDFNLLRPLISETAHRIDSNDPGMMQTGPAIRGNMAVIQKHLQLLDHHPALHDIYLKLTDSIIHKKS